jgi:uncharacterized protein YbaP (TraB family)
MPFLTTAPRLSRPLAALLALLAPLPACAKAQPPAVRDAKPALWVVKDADTTIYLFGTIHVLKPGLSWFDQAVKKAFDRSQTLVLEMVEPPAADQQKVIAAKAFRADARPLSASLSPRYRAAFTGAMASGGVPASVYDRMQPWFASITLSLLPVQKSGYGVADGPEGVLSAAARKAGKPVRGLETFEGQMSVFDGLSPAAQMKLLESTLDELPQATATMDRMVADWSAGDPDALAREMNDSLKDTPEVGKALLTDRNRRWAAWIAERMRAPGTVFVAVGAGHLAGGESVQTMLGAYRLKARRVRY